MLLIACTHASVVLVILHSYMLRKKQFHDTRYTAWRRWLCYLHIE